MSSRCHGSSGKQDSAKHKRKAGPSKAQTGDFVLLDQVYLLETIFLHDGKGNNNKNMYGRRGLG